MFGKDREKKRQSGRGIRDAAADDVLAVLTDQDSGKEYYVSIIDNFDFQNVEYAVMYNYRSDSGRRAPELVFMRSYRTKDGKRYFSSIRRKRELSIVYELFCKRYFASRRQQTPS